MAKAIEIKLQNETIVSSTRANMDYMAKDKVEKISIKPKQGKTKPAKGTPVGSQQTEPTEPEIPVSDDLLRGKIPKQVPAVTGGATWPPQVQPPELTLD